VNYYPFHIGDYVSATRHLSWEEDAAYRRLLDVYYTTEKPLPLEPRAVFRLVLATTDSQREAVEVVLNEFFDQTGDGWISHRADAEIQAMREKQQKQRDRASRGWEKRRNATAMPRHTPRDATASENDDEAMPPTPTPTPTPTPKEKQTPARARVPLRPDSVTEPVWQDFLAIRKAKRSPLTDTALEGIAREAAKAGMTLAEALTLCCERGWQGFNAGWVADRPRAQSAPSRYGATIAALTGRTKQPEVIDVEPALTRIAR